MFHALSILMLATAPATAPAVGDSLFAHLTDIHAVRLTAPITIDGVLNEPVWQQAEPVTNFIQSDPVQGAAPSQKTEVRVAYDDKAFYIGARMWDTAPDSIIARLVRRDVWVASDRFAIFVDPFHDRRTGYYFEVNAAGTLYDGTLFNCDWDESSWDGVWEGKAKRDDKGWTVEVRIPFSQLRFRKEERYLWGINFRREIPRHNESDWVVFVPRNQSGFVSRFPSLTGIEHVTPGRYLEVLPYVTSKAEYLVHGQGDPFNDGSVYTNEFGGDIRTGLGSNLTLNATVNPDFGQVEVDPAVVNLTDTETFFQEKRPFFVEGNTIYNFGNQGANNYWGFNWQDPKFFYTRRIGRAPQGAQPDANYSDVPDGARILGAGKLTGRVMGGWNLGTLVAITQQVTGQFDTTGTPWKQQLEPTTFYGVTRVLRGFNKDRQGLGFMGTFDARQFNDGALPDQLSDHSLMLGMDGWTFLDRRRTWVVSGWSAMSNVHGTQARITDLQRSSYHYFQRPDSRYLFVDSAATSLTGYGTRLWINKQNGRIIANSAIGFTSPRFDVNDMGFMGPAGPINAHSGWGYKWTENGKFKKYAEVLTSVFATSNFDGNITLAGVWAETFQQFMNNWDWSFSGMLNPWTVSDRQTRGGPLMSRPGASHWNFYGETDSKQRYYFFCGSSYDQDQVGGWDANVNPGVEWKPVSSMVMRFGPNFFKSIVDAQYVGQYTDPLANATYGTRYVFGNLDQTQVSADVSMSWSVSPTLSLQLYAQPLISTGHYSQFKELAKPKSYDFLHYGKDGGSTFDPSTGTADPDGAGPAPPIAIGHPDFNVLSLRGNSVLRWEYRPGSAIFFVWTQTRSEDTGNGDFNFGNSMNQLASVKANNIFMTKLTYYFGR